MKLYTDGWYFYSVTPMADSLYEIRELRSYYDGGTLLDITYGYNELDALSHIKPNYYTVYDFTDNELKIDGLPVTTKKDLESYLDKVIKSTFRRREEEIRHAQIITKLNDRYDSKYREISGWKTIGNNVALLDSKDELIIFITTEDLDKLENEIEEVLDGSF